MGWWWKSNETPQQTPTKEIYFAEPPPTEPQREFGRIEETSRKLTRDEQSDQELIEFLRELQVQTEENKLEDARKAERILPAPTKPSPPAEDISPESLYPKEIHCRSAFDYAFFCQSFGGQFVNVYRYGSFRSCSNHWQDFWLCMRTRNWEEKARVKAIQDHYKQRAVKYKKGPSSEDVWEIRTEPVKDAFQGDLEALESKIEEWKIANPDSQNPYIRAT